MPIGCSTRSSRNDAHGVARPDRATDDGGDDVRRARRVVEDGARRVGERPGLGVGGDVVLALAEEHLDHVRTRRRRRSPPPIARPSRICSRWSSVMAARSSSHPGTPGGCVEPEPPLPHQHADGGVEHRLRHRPRQQRRVRLDRLRRSVEVRRARRRSARAAAARPGRRRPRRWCRSAPRRRTPRRPTASSRPAERAAGPAARGPRHARGLRRRERQRAGRPRPHRTRSALVLSCRRGRRRARPRRPGCPSTARCRDRRGGTAPARRRSGPSAVTTSGSVSRSTWSLSRIVRWPPGGISRSWRPSITSVRAVVEGVDAEADDVVGAGVEHA